MNSGSNISEEPGRQPPSSLLNTFSSFFIRDRSPSSDMEPAVLMSFKELPDGVSPPPEDANNESSQRAESLETCMDFGKQLKAATGASVDPDLVQVTRVETYSDTEDDELSHSSTSLSDKLSKAKEPILPEEDNSEVDCGDGEVVTNEAEIKVPVFRTHKFTERSRIEAILYSSRFVSRTSPRTVPVTKHGESNTPKPPTTVSVDAETFGTEENSCKNVVTDDSDEYVGVDCSQPVPSIISGHDDNYSVASPLKQTDELDSKQKEEMHEQKDESEERSEKPHSIPSRPKTPEAPGLSSSSPNSADGTKSGFKNLTSPSSAPDRPLGDILPSASPSLQPTSAPKTPETNAPTTASPFTPSSASPSPSKSTLLSSPPSFQMPALFSGLRVLKKGTVGEDRETVSEIKQREKDADLALLNLKKTVNKAKLFPEQRTAIPAKKQTEPKPVAETKSTVVEQLSHLLNLENQDENKKLGDNQEHINQKSENDEEIASPSPESPASTPERKKTSDLAYETFRNIFGPKTVKKDKTEDVDLEAVKKKIKNDKENLRSIFERASKSPGKELKSPEPNVCNHTLESF